MFTLRDQFDWSRQQVLSEANDMAIRHADLMGWESVEIKDITGTPTKDGPYFCYEFEIWGMGTSNLESDTSENSTKTFVDSISSKVAKQPEL